MSINKKILTSCLFFLVTTGVFAGEMCKMQAGGALDSILASIYAPTSQWRSSLLPSAIKIYWMFVVLEMGYQIAVKKVLAGDHQKLWYFVLVRMFTATAFAQIFVNPDVYIWIVQAFIKFGANAGGISINPVSGDPFGNFSPSAVMGIGNCMWNNLSQAIKAANFYITDFLAIMTIAMPSILLVFGIFLLLAAIAITLFITALEAYVVLNAGIILLGFAGSSWTMGFWNKYLSYVGGIAIRLFVMCLILGLMNTEINKSLAVVNQFINVTDPNTFGRLYEALFGMFTKVIIFAFLIMKIPALAGSMLTGTVNSGLGDVIAGASMMLAGAGIAKGLAKMGVNVGSGGGGGGSGGKQSLMNSLRGNGANNMPVSNEGGGSSKPQSTPTQQAKLAGAENQKLQALSEKFSGNGSKSNSSTSGFGGNNVNGVKSGGNSNSAQSTSKAQSGGGANSNTSKANNNSSSNISSSSNANNGSSSSGGALTNGCANNPQSSSGVNSKSASANSNPPSSNSKNLPSSGSDGLQNATSGSIGGNANNTPASGVSNQSTEDKREQEKKAKAIKDSIAKHSGNLGKNFNKVNQDHNSGVADVHIGIHREP